MRRVRKNKYGNVKTTLDGIVFDSRAEANRYAELKMLEKGGAITDLKLQVPFELIPAFIFKGKKQQSLKYGADFVYVMDGEKIIEDVKSPATRNNQVYKIKKKFMNYKGYDIREV